MLIVHQVVNGFDERHQFEDTVAHLAWNFFEILTVNKKYKVWLEYIPDKLHAKSRPIGG